MSIEAHTIKRELPQPSSSREESQTRLSQMRQPFVHSIPHFVAIQLSVRSHAAIMLELSFTVWLTVQGLNVARWQEMAERSRPA